MFTAKKLIIFEAIWLGSVESCKNSLRSHISNMVYFSVTIFYSHNIFLSMLQAAVAAISSSTTSTLVSFYTLLTFLYFLTLRTLSLSCLMRLNNSSVFICIIFSIFYDDYKKSFHPPLNFIFAFSLLKRSYPANTFSSSRKITLQMMMMITTKLLHKW